MHSNPLDFQKKYNITMLPLMHIDCKDLPILESYKFNFNKNTTYAEL